MQAEEWGYERLAHTRAIKFALDLLHRGLLGTISFINLQLMRILRTTLIAATVLLFTWNLGISAASEPMTSDWPAKIVAVESLRPITQYRIKVAGIVTKGPIVGPATLRAHVDTEGIVVRTVLLSSCGNPDLDEAALHAMRNMRFKPYAINGVPTEVTLIVPVHIPKRIGRTD